MAKRVLIIGGGGREHALSWKLSQSPLIERIYTAPGNAGTAATNVNISANDISGLIKFALSEKIDLAVVGPEEPLSLGVTDAFEKAGIMVFGPSKAASLLETSKSFAKKVMSEAGVPTAAWEVFEQAEAAKEYIRRVGAPLVLKADGLAGGKGVIVAMTLEEALEAVDELEEAFGQAGKRIVIEEFLSGLEVSLLCFCDGKTAKPMVAVQDHKRALDLDQGLNTGGMGTYAPPPFWNKELETLVVESAVMPVLDYMRERGTSFKGVLFTGLMLTENGPKVLEYNVRFGDPETQVVMLLLKTDLYPLLEASVKGELDRVELEWQEGSAVCVIMAAPGYPLSYPKGIPITIPSLKDYEMVFHAGTSEISQQLVSSGGRVLGVSAIGSELGEARNRVYSLVERISFPEAHFRRDIGLKGMKP